MKNIAVELKDLSFHYQCLTRPSLKNLNLQIEKGSLVLITGASGCGKTTLFRCMNGLVPHFYEGKFSGDVRLGSQNTSAFSLQDFGKLTSSVFQDPRSQFFMTDVENEIAFGCVNQKLSKEEIWKRTDAAVSKMRISELLDKSIFKLSSGELQKVAFASCYAMQNDIFLLDEPSANLDFHSILELQKILEELKNEGKTIIIFEHRLFYLKDLLDRMIILEEGVIKQDYDREQTLSLNDKELEKLGLRSFSLEKLKPVEPMFSTSNNQPLINLSDISFSYKKHGTKIVKNICFSASEGEVIAVIGKNGAGKTTLAKICCGLLKEKSGKIFIKGKTVPKRKRPGLCYFVMQDSDYQLFGDSVENELNTGCKKNHKAEKNQELLEQFNLWDKKDCHPASLSRGQKQRLTIACALKAESKIIFFDEPTSGLDRKNMLCVAEQIQKLAADGKCVFVITHDYEFILSACKRILYLWDGKIQKDFSLTDETKYQVLELLGEGGDQDE